MLRGRLQSPLLQDCRGTDTLGQKAALKPDPELELRDSQNRLPVNARTQFAHGASPGPGGNVLDTMMHPPTPLTHQANLQPAHVPARSLHGETQISLEAL